MINAKTATISCAIGAFATFTVLATIINSYVEASLDIRDIETNEHADGIIVAATPTSEAQDGTTYLNGYWKKSVLEISFFPTDNLPQSRFDEVTKSLANSTQMVTTQASMNQSEYAGWPELLHAIAGQSKNVPSLMLIEPSSNAADISVFFHDEPHPEGRLGSAKIARDKATLEILAAEVNIYSTSDLYKSGYLKATFEHELGHALGIGHATLETSLMHSPIVIIDGKVYSAIKNCEFSATYSLYVEGIVDTVPCSVPSN